MDDDLDRMLDGLDPYDLLDREAARLDEFFSSLADDAWNRPSRCEGWTVRDVLAHLASAEDYHHACLDNGVAAFVVGFAEAGATTLDDANEMGVRAYDGRSTGEVLADWRVRDARTRREMRERDGGTMDTSVGQYPVRRQAFHVASELATHADDVGVPVTDDEADERLAWRVRFSRFALAETKPGTEIDDVDAGLRVRSGGVTVTVAPADFVAAVAARLPADHPLRDEERAALSTMP